MTSSRSAGEPAEPTFACETRPDCSSGAPEPLERHAVEFERECFRSFVLYHRGRCGRRVLEEFQ
jgi:hypothetical protein